MNGFTVHFNSKKGYGFIRSEGLDHDLFVHITDIKGHQPLVAGQPVSFSIQPSPKGDKAVHVIPGSVPIKPFNLYLTISLILSFITFGMLTFHYQWGWMISYLISVNVTVGIGIAYDKLAARLNILRVPEFLLLLYTLLGGTPFAYLFQQVFRHKTIKKSYRLSFWIIIILQCIILALWIYLKTI